MDLSQLVGQILPSPGSGPAQSTAPKGRQAIQLRLTEDVLQRLIQLAASGEGKLKIDLGSNPVSERLACNELCLVCS